MMETKTTIKSYLQLMERYVQGKQFSVETYCEMLKFLRENPNDCNHEIKSFLLIRVRLSDKLVDVNQEHIDAFKGIYPQLVDRYTCIEEFKHKDILTYLRDLELENKQLQKELNKYKK